MVDLNHDGYNDIVALHSGWMALTWYAGKADGTFADYEVYDLPYNAVLALRKSSLYFGGVRAQNRAAHR